MAKMFLIDDRPAVRHGLGLVLASAAHTICGEAGSIGETFSIGVRTVATCFGRIGTALGVKGMRELRAT